MKIEIIPPDEYSWARIQVNDQWIIECMFTIFLSSRVCLRQVDEVSLQCNWCAGNQVSDILYLVNTVLGYLEAGDEDLMPFCSNIKPYHRDERFMTMIRPYHKVFIKDLPGITISFTHTIQ